MTTVTWSSLTDRGCHTSNLPATGQTWDSCIKRVWTQWAHTNLLQQSITEITNFSSHTVFFQDIIQVQVILSRCFFASQVFLQDRCQPSSPQLEGEYTELKDVVNSCQSALCEGQGSTGVTWSSGTTPATVLIECKLHFQSYIEA